MTNEDLRAWRKRNGLTQEKAAKFICKSLQQYRKYEYGTASIPPLVVKIISMSETKAS